VKEYGDAIRELASANIFPGDMLWKNFGVTRYGRVVFYDYDEIEYMTDCKFRHIPDAPYPEMELANEPWYSVARNDVFPEEFATFLLVLPKIREAFLRYHADLLKPEFWQGAQEDIAKAICATFSLIRGIALQTRCARSRECVTRIVLLHKPFDVLDAVYVGRWSRDAEKTLYRSPVFMLLAVLMPTVKVWSC